MGESSALYRVSPDGSGEPQLLDDSSAEGDIGNYWITADSSRIVYASGYDEASGYGYTTLYSMASDGSGAPVLLSGPHGRGRRYR